MAHQEGPEEAVITVADVPVLLFGDDEVEVLQLRQVLLRVRALKQVVDGLDVHAAQDGAAQQELLDLGRQRIKLLERDVLEKRVRVVQLLQVDGARGLNAVSQQDQRSGPAFCDVGQVLRVIQRDFAAENFAEELHDLIAAKLKVGSVEVGDFLAHRHHRQDADLWPGAAAEDHVAPLWQPVEPSFDGLSRFLCSPVQVVKVVDDEEVLLLRLATGAHHQLGRLLRRRRATAF